MHYEPATPTRKHLPSPSTSTPSSMGIVVPKTICGGCRNAYYPIRVKIPSYRRRWQNWDLSLAFLLTLPSLWLTPRPYSSSWDASLSTAPVPTSVEASPLGCRRYSKTPLTGRKERIWSAVSQRSCFRQLAKIYRTDLLNWQTWKSWAVGKNHLTWDEYSVATIHRI